MPRPDVAGVVITKDSIPDGAARCRIVTFGRRPTPEGEDIRARLDVAGWGLDGASVIQWEPGPDPAANQTWVVVRAPGSDLICLVAAHSGRVLDITAERQAMTYEYNGLGNQWWRMGKPASDGSVTLRPSWSGGDLVLDVPAHSSRDNGARVYLGEAHGGNNQQFMFEWL